MTDVMCISLTHQCQHHCFYCPSPRRGGTAPEPSEVLSYCREAVQRGVTRFMLTGGEPLLYPQLASLIAQLKALSGVCWVGISTNGLLLCDHLAALRQADLDGVNLHLDTVDAAVLRAVTGTGKQLNAVLQAIWLCAARGPQLTITAVLHRQMEPGLAVLAGLTRQLPITLRLVQPDSPQPDWKLPDREALTLLQTHIPTLRQLTPEFWQAEGWKGRICFGRGLCGAFGMEQAQSVDLAREDAIL